MRVLLDTHILLWTLADDQKFSRQGRRLIEDASEIYVSAAAFWELAIKIGLGKLSADLDEIRNCSRESGSIELPLPQSMSRLSEGSTPITAIPSIAFGCNSHYRAHASTDR